MGLETICDDPYGSPLARAMDKIPLQSIYTVEKRRMDISLDNQSLDSAVFFNRITGDERTLYQSEFLYAEPTDLSVVTSKYAKPR